MSDLVTKIDSRLRMVFIAILLMIFGSVQAFAGSNQNLVYQGRIVRPDGTVPNSGSLTFTLSVYSPSPTKCLLYSETQIINMTGAQGMFSVQLGAGTRVDGGAYPFNNIFVNGSTLSGLTCATGTSYTAGATDDRDLLVSLNDAGTILNLASMPIRSVPFALQAHEVDGWGLNNLVKVSSTGSPTTFTTAEMANAKLLTAPGPCATNEILKWNGSAWGCSADATGGSPADAGYTGTKGIVAFDTDAATSGITVASGIAKLSNTTVTAATYGTASKVGSFAVNAQGRITSAIEIPISIPSTQITGGSASTGDVLKWNGSAWLPAADATGTSPGDATYAAKGLVQGDTDAATSGLNISSGVISVNSGTAANQIVKLDASAKLPSVDGSQLTNLSTSQLSAGTLPVSKGGTGSAAALTNNKVMVSSGGAIVEGSGFGSGKAANTFVTRDASGNFAAGVGTFDSLKLNGSTSGTLTLTVPSSFTSFSLNFPSADGSAGQFLKTDGSGNLTWATVAGAPGDSTYSAKGIVQFNTDAATSGVSLSSGVATVNTGTGANQIVKLDASSKLPAVDGSALTNLSANNISSGTLPISRGGTGTSSLSGDNLVGTNTTGTALQSVTCAQNQVLSFDAAGKYGCYNLSAIAGGTYFANGGNSFAGAATLGTNDNNTLALKTNNTVAMTIDTSGNVGIGKVPGVKLDVNGTTMANAFGLDPNNYWDTTKFVVTGNVGIGTSSPSFPLHVLKASAANDTNTVVGWIQGGTDGTLGPVGLDITVHPSATGSNRFVAMSSGDSGGIRPLILNMTAGGGFGKVGVGTSSPSTIFDVSGTIKVANGGESCSAGADGGMIRYSGGNLQFCNGASWQTLGVSGAGLTNLNGLTTSTQSFVTATTGTDFTISSAGSAHTFAIPSASSSARGLLTSADWSTFNNKLGTSTAFSGDVSGTYNATSVDKIKAAPVSISSLSSGNFLKYNGSAWVNASLGSSDITGALGYTPVNKAGDTMSGSLDLAGKNLTNVGTLALKGSTSGTLSMTVPATVTSYTLNWPAAVGSANQVLSTDASGNLSWATVASATNTFVNGGNSFGGAATLGTNDNNSLAFETNNSTRMTIDTSGNVGIGTASPSEVLEVVGVAKVDTLKIGSNVTEKTFQVSFPAGTANQKVDLVLGNVSTTASFVVSLSSSWSGEDAIGVLEKTFALGFNPGGAITHQDTYYSKALGAVSNSFAISDLSWDAANTTYRIQIVHRTSTSNPVYVSIRGLHSQANTVVKNTTMGSIYTTDATVFAKPQLNFPGNVGINTANPGAALDVMGEVRMSGATSGYAGFKAPAVGPSVTWTLPTADGSSGQFLKTDGSGNLSWASASTAAITSLNGLTAATQTFAIGTSGNSPNFSSATATHTLNIPMASTASVTAGLISKTDYDAFNTKLGTSTSFSGDVSGTYNATSVDKIKGAPLSIASLSSGNFLKYNGSAWVNSGIAASDITSGTLPVSRGGTGAVTFAANNLVGTNSTGTVLQAVTCAQNQVLSFDASGFYGCYNLSTIAAGTYFANGGNSFAGAATLGTNDNNTLAFKTNNSNRMTIDTSGNVGIGASPGYGLDVRRDTIYFADSTNTKTYLYSDGTGNINIGSSLGPTARLQVSNASSVTTNATDLLVSHTATSNTASITKTGADIQSTGAWSGAGAVNIGLNVNVSGGTTNYAALFSGGNVGVGTATPSVPLHVKNTTNATLLVESSNTQSTGINIKNTSVGGHEFQFYSTGSAAANGAGNFGVWDSVSNNTIMAIGGTSGDLRVISSGKIGFSSSTTDATSNPDTAIARNAAGVMEVDNGTAGQYRDLYLREIRMYGATSGYAGLKSPATGPSVTWILPTADGSSGQFLKTDGAGNLSWASASTAAITSLNGLTASTQTFAIGTSGNSPSFSSATATHTLNIPMASTASVTAGLISKTDYDAFNTKLGTSTSFSGDVSGTYNATSVDKIKAAPVSISSLSSGNFLKYNGSAWVNTSLASADITGALGYTPVNRAGDTMSGALNLNGQNITNLGSESFKGTTSGTLSITVPATVTSYTMKWPSAVASSSTQALTSDTSGNLSWTTVPLTSNTFMNNGNSFGGTATLGTNDSNSLVFETNNSNQMTIDATGNVGIGTSPLSSGIAIWKDRFFIADSTGSSPYMYGTGGKIVFGDSSTPTAKFQTVDLGSRATNETGVLIQNSTTSSTASVTKTGVDIQSTGAWNGTGASNIGLKVTVGGGTTNYAATFQGGNVGIGTLTPWAKLDVIGTDQSVISRVLNTDSTTAHYPAVLVGNYIGTAGSGAPQLVVSNSRGNDSAPSPVLVGDTLGSVVFSGESDTNWNTKDGATIRGVAEENFSSTANGSSMRFYTAAIGASASTERMRIDPSGNIGVATTTPQSALDVKGDVIIRSNTTTNWHEGLNIERPGTSNYSWLIWGTGLASNAAPDGTTADFLFGQNSGDSDLWLLSRGYSSGALGRADAVVRYGKATGYTMFAGRVGIGTNAPGYMLHVVGTAGLSTGTAWTNASDIRLKDIDGDYEYGLDEILKLHTVRFHYKKDNALNIPSDHPMTGFIAQEVQKVIPDAVHVRDDGYLELNVDPIHWATVNAVQQLHGMCKMTETQIQAIKKQVDSHERRIASVESENKQLKAENQRIAQENERIAKENAQLKERMDRIEKMLLKK